MRKLLSFAVGAAMFAGIASTQQLKAQVYTDFNLSIKSSQPYTSVVGQAGTVMIPLNSFIEHPSGNQDLDNGYAKIKLPFEYIYNGTPYDSIFVSVNGFIQFASNANSSDADNPMAMFVASSSYPENVIAPFWGDHFYRTGADINPNPGSNQYAMSTISTHTTADNSCFTIEWKNLNIINRNITSSVASFQVKIYKPLDTLSGQGVIEFAYGTAGPQPGTSETTVITKDASIGIKGWEGLEGNKADYINALNGSSSNTLLSTNWPPTGATDKVFRFDPILKYYELDKWGDGDADMSKANGGLAEHKNKAQNIYVTPSDAKVIMTAVATNTPLDSLPGRSAFHGDVNHSGRFVWGINPLTNKLEKFIQKRDDSKNTTNPYTGISQYFPNNFQNVAKFLRYQVTEFDAALIIHYRGNHIPMLPWLMDTVVNYGKVQPMATSVQFSAPTVSAQGTVTMSVSLNGIVNGALATKFDIDGIIEDVKVADPDLAVEYTDNRLVIAGTTKFNSGEAICWVTFRTNNNGVNISNITYNDLEVENLSLSLASVDGSETDKMLNNYPNPFTNSTAVTVNVEKSGFYTLSIYDMQGNLVKTLLSDNVVAGLSTHPWDGTDNIGNRVQSGMYIYRLIGKDVSVSNTMQLVK